MSAGRASPRRNGARGRTPWIVASMLHAVAAAQAPNDLCANATPIVVGVNGPFNNLGAGVLSGPTSCAGIHSDVWFSFTPPATAPYQIDVCAPTPGAVADSVLAVYPSCAQTATALACADDVCGTGPLVYVNLTAGVTVFVRVGNYVLDPTQGAFLVAVSPPIAPPANDACVSALPVGIGVNGPFLNVAAAATGAPPSCGPGDLDLWFTFTPACAGAYVATTDCFAYDTVLAVHVACGGAEIACNDDAPGCPRGSQVTWVAAAGATYRLRVAAAGVPGGTFTLTVSEPPLDLLVTQPFGPGSALLEASHGPPGAVYFLAVSTLNPGHAPTGYFYGVAPDLSEIVAEILFGPPFLGALDACGRLTVGPIVGLPPGFAFDAVLLAYGAAPGFSQPIAVSPAVAVVLQ